MLKDLLSIPSPPSTKQELRGASWFPLPHNTNSTERRKTLQSASTGRCERARNSLFPLAGFEFNFGERKFLHCVLISVKAPIALSAFPFAARKAKGVPDGNTEQSS
jgi:hypothetical protein